MLVFLLMLPIIEAKELFVVLGFEPAWASIDGFSGRLAARTGMIPAPGHR